MKKPNLIFILSDDHGYGDTSCYYGPHVQTPNIDRIGASGIRFTQFYANSSVCSPSRAALLTGRYPDMVGVPGVIRTHAENSWGYFDPQAVTLPQQLHHGGYHCTHIGKWHLGLEEENHPCRRGFDDFRGFLGDMMDDYITHLRHDRNYMRHNHEEIDPTGHATDLFTDWAVETIRDRASQPEPFFLYLAYNAPHTPIQPLEAWVEKIREREPGIPEKRLQYLALVEHMDEGIGRVLDQIEASGIADDTLVVYASDNGGYEPAGACNDPWRGQKGDMYEGGIRVPCCVSWPGRITPGQVSDLRGLLMDWFPTFCDAADVPITHEIEGLSLMPDLRGESRDLEDRILYWVRREGYGSPQRPFLGEAYRAVRRRNFKLLHNGPFMPLELYDLAADEQESRDRATEEEDTVRELSQVLQSRIQEAGAIPFRKR